MDFFFIPTALAMDAFAVSISLGISILNVTKRQALKVSFMFGFFQFIMPIAGYLLASLFSKYIQAFDHWIAFSLLIYLGVNMIVESFNKDSFNKNLKDPTKGKNIFLLSIATSIDAMAIGVAFAVLKKSIIITSISTGIITSLLSLFGIKCGCFFGKKFGKIMEVFGGFILIFIGSKILIEHLFFN
jgi:putative Mn2+ efflux pump MntP